MMGRTSRKATAMVALSLLVIGVLTMNPIAIIIGVALSLFVASSRHNRYKEQ